VSVNDDKRRLSETTDGQPPRPGYEYGPAPAPIDPRTGQHESYWVLSADERAKGFVRPVRRSYRHVLCGTVTRMGSAIAETYARDPKYYSATFCVHCKGHFPVGEHGEFVWEGTHDDKVGT
jgi:hypothetical protein